MTMSSADRRDSVARAVREVLHEDAITAQVNARIMRVRSFPTEDPHADGTVLRFDRHLNGVTYAYVALRVDGVWFLTGGSPKTPQRVMWRELIIWLVTEDDDDFTEDRIIVLTGGGGFDEESFVRDLAVEYVAGQLGIVEHPRLEQVNTFTACVVRVLRRSQAQDGRDVR